MVQLSQSFHLSCQHLMLALLRCMFPYRWEHARPKLPDPRPLWQKKGSSRRIFFWQMKSGKTQSR